MENLKGLNAFGRLTGFLGLFACIPAWAAQVPGGIVAAANPALPASFRFQEYRYPEPADSKACVSAENPAAVLGPVRLAQTHLMEPGWPFFFLIADRPALIQVVVTGSGPSPDIKVQAYRDGASLGTICLKGPATLPAAVTADPGLAERFSATLPAAWLKPGLSLEIKAGAASRTLTAPELKLGMAPELNLIMLPFDVLDWNQDKPDIPVPETFLADFASAMPASVVRLGRVGGRMKLPRLVVSSSSDTVPVVLETRLDKKGVEDGNINAAALRFLEAFKRGSGDYSWAYFYGNTENFFPGGWGGDKSFVGADFGGVFLHEMGHGLSLPHWGEGAYQNQDPDANEYRYPYGGTTADGGGRGEIWNYYQNLNEFVSPICGLRGNPEFGKERSDAMQRTHWCEEQRAGGRGPWDGFGDFSSYAMHSYMVGADSGRAGSVAYRGAQAPYHLARHPGFPTLKLAADGARILERNAFQPARKQDWERYDFLVPQKWDAPVYTVYGTYHPRYREADFLYEPMAYMGNLPRLLDPTDPATFADLSAGGSGSYGSYFWWEKDLTFKFTYADGTVRHALYPYAGVSRAWKVQASPWRPDLLYFAFNIPADRKLSRIELYRRPFLVRGANGTEEGNIANPKSGITAANFMAGAVLVLGRDVDVAPPAVVGKAATGDRNIRFRIASGGAEFRGLRQGAVLEIFSSRGERLASIREREGLAVWPLAPVSPTAARGVYLARVRDPGGTESFRFAIAGPVPSERR